MIPSTHSYVQFHPLMYLIKLKIEMNMADLIVKIVKATSLAPGHELHRYAARNSAVHLPQRPALNAGSHNNSDKSSNSCKTKESTLPSSHSQTDTFHDQKLSTNNAGWALTRLPTNFDARDVVDRRKTSVAEGSVGMVPVPMMALKRPALMRNMSEMTQLEVGAGYLDWDARQRASGIVEQSPVSASNRDGEAV